MQILSYQVRNRYRRNASGKWPCTLAVSLALFGFSAVAAEPDYQTVGIEGNLPVFHRRIVERLTFPLSWTAGPQRDFAAWRDRARAHVRTALLAPPPSAPWRAVVLEEQDRGTHVARKIAFNLTGDSRVLAYLTIPKGRGPFPAALLLHDHGGKYDIGKEKVIRPWNVPAEKQASAEAWTTRLLGGRFIGDVLAERGYVCLSVDMLNWSDRGGGGSAAQALISSNLLHVGMSFAGLIAWEDLRAAEFLAQHADVDSGRVAAVGLSVGGMRAWQVAALSEHIAAGVSVCWMTTVKSLMTSENNQTRTTSAYTGVHPGLLDDLDYPDIASIAAPKPMLFYNGRSDTLFPAAGVDQAYEKMRAVWSSQQAGDKLVTRTWDAGHVFDRAMQDEAFEWLDQVLDVGSRRK